MLYDSKLNRILLRDGTSVVDSFTYAKMLIEGSDMVDSLFVATDEDSVKYDTRESVCISREIEEIDVSPVSELNLDAALEELVTRVESSTRLKGSSEEQDRVLVEIDYFERSDNVEFMVRCCHMLDEFKKNGVVWGVGRGSSCASYVMYLLGFHDVDSMRFDIPFSELSKEQDY